MSTALPFVWAQWQRRFGLGPGLAEVCCKPAQLAQAMRRGALMLPVGVEVCAMHAHNPFWPFCVLRMSLSLRVGVLEGVQRKGSWMFAWMPWWAVALATRLCR